MFTITLCLLLLQTPLKDQEAFRQPYTEGANALNANKLEEARRLLEKAYQLNNHHTGCRYALAIARAATGDKAGALSMLEELANEGLSFRLNTQQAWIELENDPAYRAIAAKIAANSQSKQKAEIAFQLAERDLFPEGIAHDPKTERFFVGSVHQRKIVAIDKKGVATDFVPASRGLLWSVLGILADAPNRKLWVVSAALDETKDVGMEKGRSAVLCFDLDTGSLLEKILTPNQSGPSLLGDLVLAPNGDLYLSDGGTGTVFLLKKGSKELEAFFVPGFLRSPQGMAIDPEGKRLYISDYSYGLFVYEFSKGHFRRVRHEKGINTLGGDGLIWTDKGLISIQNGINPHRVVRWTLDKSGLGIAKQEILEVNHPNFNEPTLGTVVGKELYFVATSQWGAYGEDHKPLPVEKLGPIQIMKLGL